jgi:hypothetical protein
MATQHPQGRTALALVVQVTNLEVNEEAQTRRGTTGRHCIIEGRTVAASYVDHVDPHRGQWLLFFKYENTQSLCAHHHNMRKQQENRATDCES